MILVLAQAGGQIQADLLGAEARRGHDVAQLFHVLGFQAGLLQQQGLHQTFVGGLGQAALLEGGDVDLTALLIGDHLHHQVPGVQGQDGVNAVGALGRQNVWLGRQGLDVSLGQSQGGEDVQVHELLLVEVLIGGELHVRR